MLNSWRLVYHLRRQFPYSRIPYSTLLHHYQGIRLGNGVNIGIRTALLVYPPNWEPGGGTIELGPNVKVGAMACLFAGSGSIVIQEQADIGHGAKLMAQRINTALDQALPVSGTISIGKSCWIGAGAIILADTSLGNHCVVAAGAVVQGHYPDHTTLVGNPARAIPRINHEQS